MGPTCGAGHVYCSWEPKFTPELRWGHVARSLAFSVYSFVDHCTFTFGQWISCPCSRRVWIYQRGNQNPYIEEEQSTQWPREKEQKDKQRSTKHTKN
jgi:hypothetical protein